MTYRDDSAKWELVKQFTVPGQPVGKGRPRFFKAGKGVRSYTPAKTKEYERAVGLMCPGRAISAGAPVRLRVLAVMKRPQSMMARRYGDGLLMCPKKPDADNILKACMDALNGVAYADDNQVTDAEVQTRYAERQGKPRTEIEIYTLNNTTPQDQER